MDEYIEREALLAAYDQEHEGEPGRARELIANAPAEDVQPVRHGRWIEDSDPGQEIGTAWRCSSCDLTIGMKKVEKDWHHYCPNCGAHMMEEDNGL